jgi:hypothetical protein
MQGYLQNVLNILKTNLPNAQVFVASLTPRATGSAAETVSVQYSAGIPSMLTAMGSNFHFVDLHTNFPSNGLSSDNTHPVEVGYDWMAGQWLAAIQSALQPTANTDTATTPANTPVTISVLSNDTDPSSFLPLTVTAVSTAVHGTVVLNGNNTATYTPASNYTGSDSFTYTVADARGLTASGTVNVTVSAAAQGYSAWAATNNLTGANANVSASPAKDGITNLVKYALGLNPNQMVWQMTTGTTPGLPWVFLEGTNECMIYQKDTTKTDITYASQNSADLSNWSTTGITETVQGTSGNIQTIKAVVAMGTDKKKFLRLQVTKP